jgi:hypothetical protein
MSYIRSGGNPEKLYIWGDGEKATIAEGSKDTWNIPLNIFNGLIRKFHRRFHDYPVVYKGAQVEEVWVDENGIESDSSVYLPLPHLKRLECKVKLSYYDDGEVHSVIMWDVTWEYIVYSNIEKITR